MKSKKKILMSILVSIIAGLVVLWLALESGIRRFLNEKIDNTEQMSGNVGPVSIKPLKDLFTVGDIELSYTSDATDMPKISIRSVVLNLNWASLFSGALVGRAKIIRPDFRVIKKSSTAKEVPRESPPLARTIKSFIPIRVDFISISNGELKMRDKTQPVALVVDITGINGEIRNLTNTLKLSDNLFASADVTGTVWGSGKLSVKLKLAPVSKNLHFTLVSQIKGLKLLNLNSYLNDLAGITFEDGTLTIDMNLKAENGFIRGFVKTVYHNIKLINPENEEGILDRLQEGISDLVGEIIGDEQDQLVTRIPVTMKVQGTKPDVLFTVVLVLQQALANAIIPLGG